MLDPGGKCRAISSNDLAEYQMNTSACSFAFGNQLRYSKPCNLLGQWLSNFKKCNRLLRMTIFWSYGKVNVASEPCHGDSF